MILEDIIYGCELWPDGRHRVVTSHLDFTQSGIEHMCLCDHRWVTITDPQVRAVRILFPESKPDYASVRWSVSDDRSSVVLAWSEGKQRSWGTISIEEARKVESLLLSQGWPMSRDLRIAEKIV